MKIIKTQLGYSGPDLVSITDTLGLQSTFGYDFNGVVNSMTTPYGTTNFSYSTGLGNSPPPLFLDVEDPLGYHERLEWIEPGPGVADSDPSSTVPQGMPIPLTNQYLEYRDSFYWDRDAYIQAGCSPTGGCDYAAAKNIHFNHVSPNTDLKSTSIESVKNPLENRIWFVYPGQTNSIYDGTYKKPIAIGRVLDDSSTQLTQYSYDPVTFNVTQAVDPLGRTSTFTYSNHVDLAAISQSVSGGTEFLAQFTYNPKHRPLVYTDASGQTTLYTYNAAQQLTSVTNPLGQKTQYQYDESGDLTTIINANGATAASFTYDAYDRIATYTDSEGWTASYNYDDADRITKISYPDGTNDLYTYDKLDLSSYQDRQGRKWVYTHDANRRLTAIIDPSAHQTLFGYNGKGQVTTLTDPKGNVTSWAYDVQGRVTSKTYADSSVVSYAYETTTSRLKSITDALNSTPDVSLAYDPYYPRVVSMTDGTGTTQYVYGQVGALGALQLQQEASALPSSGISYGYDELSRLTSQAVTGSGVQTYQYDSIGRPSSDTNDLGTFTFTYLGQTSQISSRQLNGSTLATTWSYLPNLSDRRLSGISNVGLSSGQYSTYQYTTTSENFISSISETSDSPAVSPAIPTQSASYNNLNQLTNLSGQALSYDANGNLTSDGQRNYSWDAENRLVGITYPSQSGKATTFTYDGLSRRTLIASTPVGGGTATITSYLWCGTDICQARNSSGTTTREYFNEGEFVPSSPAQPYYYGVDQIGSVRRAFTSSSSAPAFSYDPYGNALQTAAPVTDFNYAGMFHNVDSGLYLTQFRVYDSVSGRWLSRDPLGEFTDTAGNLYPYVSGDPVGNVDPAGTNPLQGMIAGSEIGSMILPGWGTVIGGIVGIGGGILVGNELGNIVFAKPPSDALDPLGAKSPGKPGEAEGFCDPKGGPQWVPNPNGPGHGWLDAKGKVWVPTGLAGAPRTGTTGGAHGGPHWDVQDPRSGDYVRVYPKNPFGAR